MSWHWQDVANWYWQHLGLSGICLVVHEVRKCVRHSSAPAKCRSRVPKPDLSRTLPCPHQGNGGFQDISKDLAKDIFSFRTSNYPLTDCYRIIICLGRGSPWPHVLSFIIHHNDLSWLSVAQLFVQWTFLTLSIVGNAVCLWSKVHRKTCLFPFFCFCSFLWRQLNSHHVIWRGLLFLLAHNDVILVPRSPAKKTDHQPPLHYTTPCILTKVWAPRAFNLLCHVAQECGFGWRWRGRMFI